MDNKSRFLAFAKAAALFLWASVAIGTTFAVWNAAAGETPDGFIKFVSGMNILFTVAGVILVAKCIFFKDKK